MDRTDSVNLVFNVIAGTDVPRLTLLQINRYLWRTCTHVFQCIFLVDREFDFRQFPKECIVSRGHFCLLSNDPV